MDFAEELMSRRGYAGTSVAEIVNAAGVGPPTLYWHFKNKEGILAAVMERGAERWLSSLPTWDDLPTGSSRERLVEAMRLGGAGVSNQPQFLRLLMLLALERGEHDEAVIGAIRSIRNRSRLWMTALLRRGWPSIAPAVAEQLAFRLMAYADGLCLRQMVEPQDTVAEHVWMAQVVAREAAASVAAQRRRAIPPV